MKILHIIPTLNKGGAERIALDTCIELQRQGHTVKLVTLHPNNHYPFLTADLDYHVVQTDVHWWRSGGVELKLSGMQRNLLLLKSWWLVKVK